MIRTALRRVFIIVACSSTTVLCLSSPALAATDPSTKALVTVIDNLRTWLMIILASVATLFLTVGGLRYLTAGGDPAEVDKAKSAIRNALVGYALAILAPVLLGVLQSIVG